MFLLMRAPSARARLYTSVLVRALWEDEVPSPPAGGVLAVVVGVLAGRGWWLLRDPDIRTALEGLSSLTGREPGQNEERSRREGSSTTRANRGTGVSWRHIVLQFRGSKALLCKNSNRIRRAKHSTSNGHPTFEGKKFGLSSLVEPSLKDVKQYIMHP